MAQTSAAKNAAQNKSANGIDPRRQAALDTALAQVEKSFGKGSAMRLGRPARNRTSRSFPPDPWLWIWH